MIFGRDQIDGMLQAGRFLIDKNTDFKALPGKIAALTRLGVPYEPMNKHEIEQGARSQALKIATDLVASEVELPKDMDDMEDEAEIATALAERQIVAMIAYLQKLGAYENVDEKESSAPAIINPDKKHTVTDPKPGTESE